MKGWLLVDADGHAEDDDLRRWIDRGLAYASGSVTKGPARSRHPVGTLVVEDGPGPGYSRLPQCRGACVQLRWGCKRAAPRVIEADGGALARIVDGEVHYWLPASQRDT
jgi:hypothetical protein